MSRLDINDTVDLLVQPSASPSLTSIDAADGFSHAATESAVRVYQSSTQTVSVQVRVRRKTRTHIAHAALLRHEVDQLIAALQAARGRLE